MRGFIVRCILQCMRTGCYCSTTRAGSGGCATLTNICVTATTGTCTAAPTTIAVRLGCATAGISFVPTNASLIIAMRMCGFAVCCSIRMCPTTRTCAAAPTTVAMCLGCIAAGIYFLSTSLTRSIICMWMVGFAILSSQRGMRARSQRSHLKRCH